MLKPLFEKLETATKELIDTVRKLSIEQKDTWQKVPYLALQADGRTGYSDQYSRAYHQGYWAIEASVRNGSYRIYVDLETGELVSAFDPRKKARDEDVLLIASNLGQIDAAWLIEKLHSRSLESVGSYYNATKQERWRQETLKEYDLKPNKYKRRVSPNEVYEGNSVAGLID